MGMEKDNHASTKEAIAFSHFLGDGDGKQTCAANPPVELALPSKFTGDQKATFANVDALFRSSESSPLAITGPFPSNLMLGSERHFGNQQLPFRCPSRSDLSKSETSHRSIGSKSIKSDTTLMRIPKDGIMMPQVELGFMDPTHPRKNGMLWNQTSGEQIKNMVCDKASSHLPHQMTFGSCSSSIPQISSTQIGTTIDVNQSRWEKWVAVNLDGGTLYSNSTSSPSGYQVPSSPLQDSNSAPLILSHVTEEGARTLIKSSRILTSHVPASKAFTQNGPSLSIPNCNRIKIGASHRDPETMNTFTRLGQSSISGQLTIIYGGQVHVFDDVNPNKADIIMSLAGSSGAGWSINPPKLPLKPTTDDCSHPS